MSANVETMMYVREKPWHGLGTRVEEAPTSADALRIAGLDWQIENKPVFDGQGREIKGYKANTRNSNGSVLGIVSSRYTIVQNADAFAFTDALIGGDVRYETAGSLRGGRQVWMLARMPERTILNDAVEPYICFTNTHDGSGAVRAVMTPVRVVCNNTLNLALSGAKRAWSTPHRGDVQSRLEEARQTLELADKYLIRLDEEADRLANEKLSDYEATKVIDQLLAVPENATERIKRTAENAKQQIITCMFAPDLVQYMETKWGFLNAVADYVGHGEPARHTKSFEENRWGNIISGATLLDKAMALVG